VIWRLAADLADKQRQSEARETAALRGTVATQTVMHGVWRSVQEYDEHYPPIAVCASLESAEAVKRLERGWFVAEHRVYGRRPLLAEDALTYTPLPEAPAGRCDICDGWHVPWECTSAFSYEPDRRSYEC